MKKLKTNVTSHSVRRIIFFEHREKIPQLCTLRFALLASPVFAQQINLGDQYAFGGIRSFGQGLGYLVGPAFSLAGILLIIYFLWGAFDFITSGGDKEKVASARSKITHVIIGFMLLILMFLVLQFIPKFFGLEGFNLF